MIMPGSFHFPAVRSNPANARHFAHCVQQIGEVVVAVVIGVHRLAEQYDFRHPLGHDGFDWQDAFKPGLTIINQPALRMGRMAAELLIQRIRGALDPAGTDVYNSRAIKYRWAPDTYVAFPLMYFHYDGEGPAQRDERR